MMVINDTHLKQMTIIRHRQKIRSTEDMREEKHKQTVLGSDGFAPLRKARPRATGTTKGGT